MDLFLHIGTEKTGTSSIQRFFGMNRKILAHNGVAYPRASGDMKRIGWLSADLQKLESSGSPAGELRRARESMLAEVVADLTRHPLPMAVMSEELLSFRLISDEEVAWLRDALSRHFSTVQVIVYLRRQDEYLLSAYSTSVKSGAFRPLGLPEDRVIALRFDHWELLSRWSRVFGRDRIVCRKFERASMKSENVVDDILDVIGIDGTLPFRRPETLNESLDAECLEFLRLLNAQMPPGMKPRGRPFRRELVALLASMSNGPLLTLPEDELAKFMRIFRESNSKVALEFFGGLRSGPGDPLFGPPSDSRPRVGYAPLATDRAIQICAGLLRRTLGRRSDTGVKKRDRTEGREIRPS